MSRVRGPAVLCSIIVALAPAVFGQTRLNPTVKVLPKPTMIVPPECSEGLAPAAPRPPVETAIETAPPATTTVPPPSSDLRTRLRRVQAAAENNDYNGFKSALAEARAAVRTYPGGGEKQAAQDVLQVDSDIERLWDFSVTSPTGAFFNSSNEDLLAMLRKYPAFPRAVVDSTMTIGGQTIYPSRETRQLLVDEAAKRLRGLGVRTPTRVVQERPHVVPQPQPRVTTKHERHVAPKTAEAPRKPVVHKRPTKIAEAAPAVRKRHKEVPQTKIAQAAPKPVVEKHREEASPPKPTIATSSSGGQPPSAVPAPVPAPAPPPTTTTAATDSGGPLSSTGTTATTVTMATATTATASTAMTPTATDTTASTETTATTAPEKAPPQPGGMNLTFAIILIVVGIGVLIVLFRASD